MKPAATRIDNVPKKISRPSAKSAPSACRTGGHEAHDAVERGVEQKARKHRRNRRRRLAVRVRQPGMDRRQPGLGAVADQDEDEGELHQGRDRGARSAEASLVQNSAIGFDAAADSDRRGGEERPDKGEGDADRADDQVLPHRLERQPARIERDQEGAQQRRRLHPDPHDAEIVRHQDQHHRRQRAEPQRAEAAGDGGRKA